MSESKAGEGPRLIPDERVGPPGTNRNPITGEIRARHLIGGKNQRVLDNEPVDTDTVNGYHGVPESHSAAKEA